MHTVTDSLATLLILGLEDTKFDEKLTEWKSLLSQGQISEEMLRVFIAIGWVTPRDPRVTKEK